MGFSLSGGTGDGIDVTSTTEENETVRTVTLIDLQTDAEIDDEMFVFEPPPGADVFEG